MKVATAVAVWIGIVLGSAIVTAVLLRLGEVCK
jgi:hypothetical protein